MSGASVPERVLQWARSQSSEYTASHLAEELGLSQRSASIYLSRLAVAGKIVRLMKGRYISFQPFIPSTLQRVGLAIAREMPLTDAVLWTTGPLTQLMHDIPTLDLLVIEATPIDVEGIRDVVLGLGMPVVSRPTRRDISEVLIRSTRVLVIPSRNTYATTAWKGHLRTAMLEKVLVDSYFLSSRKGLPIPSAAIIEAMRAALDGGVIDGRVVRRYATRRHLTDDLLRPLGMSGCPGRRSCRPS